MNAEQMFELEGYTKCSVSPNEEPPTYSKTDNGVDYFISFDEKTESYHAFGVSEKAEIKTVGINYKLLCAIMQQFEELRWL